MNEAHPPHGEKKKRKALNNNNNSVLHLPLIPLSLLLFISSLLAGKGQCQIERGRGGGKKKRNRDPVFESHCCGANLTIEKQQSS